MSLHAGTTDTAGTTSPLTTKGDLYGFDSANNRIPVGADTFVLTADSTQILGVKWAAASGGVTASGPPTAGQVAIWTSATDITGNAALIFSTANGSLGVGPAVVVGAAETLSVIATETIASAAGATWNGINLQASTATLSGSTSVTTATGFNFINIGRPTVARSATVAVVSNAATLYISNSPLASGLLISNAYSIWVDDGNVRFDGVVQVSQGTAAACSVQLQGTAGTGFNIASTGPQVVRGSAALLDITSTQTILTSPSNSSTANGAIAITGGSQQPPGFSTANAPCVKFSPGTNLYNSGGGTVALYTTYYFAGQIINEGGSGTTFTKSATFYIEGFTKTGASAPTFINRYALLVDNASSTNDSPNTLVAIKPTAAMSAGTLAYLEVTGVASTAQTASTEINFVNFNLSQTVTWAAGAIATQRCVLIQAPTLDFSSASTITSAASLAITGAPAQGSNATLTSTYALWIQAGTSAFDAQIKLTPIAAPGAQVNGYLYQDSTQKTLVSYESGVAVSKAGCIFTATADVALNNSAAETAMLGTGVGTKTLAANFLVIGKTVMVEIRGYYTTGATPQTLTFKLKLGANVIATVAGFAPPINQTNSGFSINATLTCRTTGATGAIYGQGDVNFESGVLGVTSFAFLVAVATVAVDTTATQAVSISITTALADAAATYTSTDGVVEIKN